MTEQTGEKNYSSPELGFALPTLPIEEVTQRLQRAVSPEASSVVEDFQLSLAMIEQYVAHGPGREVWDTYRALNEQYRIAREHGVLEEALMAQYETLLSGVKAAHGAFVNEEAAALNQFLDQYPSLIVGDDGAALTAVQTRDMQARLWWDTGTYTDIDEEARQAVHVSVKRAALPAEILYTIDKEESEY